MEKEDASMNNFEREELKAKRLSDYVDLLNAKSAPGIGDYVRSVGEEKSDLSELITSMVALRNELAHNQLPSLSKEKSDQLFALIEQEFSKSESKTFALSSRLRTVLNARQDFLILLVHMMNQVWGRTKLVKLLFLLGKEAGCDKLIDDFYGHYAHNFGMFDKNVPKDVDQLEAANIMNKHIWLSNNKCEKLELGIPNEKKVESVYELTSTGKKIAEKIVNAINEDKPEILVKINEIVRKYGRMTTDELLRYTYNNYKEYTTKSLVREKYLNDEANKANRNGDTRNSNE
jgi:hypothetical protein